MASETLIRQPWCTGDKVGDVYINGANHSYSKWKIVKIEVEPDGFRVNYLVRVAWENN